MSVSSANTSRASGQIELMQNLFEEILQIQKENKTTDESVLRIQEIIHQSSKAVENSVSPNEMIVDAKILQTGTNYVSSNVSSLNTNLTSFSELKYIKGLSSYLENSEHTDSVGNEWHCLAPVTYKMFKKSNPVSFMLGTFTFEPPAVKEKGKTEKKHSKKGAEGEKKVLATVAEREQPVEAGSDIYDHILKWLVRHYKKNNKNPISYFNFIIDPTDYWRTIENIFHFAFLIRDGTARMNIDNGIPVIEPVLGSSEESVSEKQNNKHQFCLRLSIPEWQECIKRFHIQHPSIPPFVKKS